LRFWLEGSDATKVSAITDGGNESSAADEWVGGDWPSRCVESELREAGLSGAELKGPYEGPGVSDPTEV